MMRRAFLLLQGPATPFFTHLAKRLYSDGHRVVRVHFCAGDVAYGAENETLAYRGRVEGGVDSVPQLCEPNHGAVHLA